MTSKKNTPTDLNTSLERAEWGMVWTALFIFIMVLGATCYNRHKIRIALQQNIDCGKKEAFVNLSRMSLNQRGIRIILEN